MNNHFSDETVIRVSSVEDADAYREFAARNSSGISIIPNHEGHLEAEVSDFVKWIRADHAHLPIIYPEHANKLVLHGADIWLPLIFLAGDTSVQIFLNMLASYLYDKAKGALKNDAPTVHISVMYQNKIDGTVKKFEFTGDAEALAKAVKKFDLNNFFDDRA